MFDAFAVSNSVNLTRPLGNIVSGIINSLEIRWSSVSRRVDNFSDSANRFRGSFVENKAAIQVTATTPVSTGHGFQFVSSETVSSNFAQIGQESNGSFF